MKKNKTRTLSPISKYKLYEYAVQSPMWQVEYLPQFHHYFLGKKPISMREDFCGSGKISCEWVKLTKKNVAVGLDLDEVILKYAREVNQAELTIEQKTRVKFLKQNVLTRTRDRFDWIGAYNFSFFTFHERSVLLKYFKSVYQSLNQKGSFFLEIAGGAGFRETIQIKRKFKVPGHGMCLSTWQQKQYDPISQVNQYAIHLKDAKGHEYEDAFTYDWRIWEIREVREVLADAGFQESVVLWEDLNSHSDEYQPQEHAEDRHDWIAYIVGLKK